MKKLPLSRGKYSLVDDEDYEHLSQYNWFYTNNGYAESRMGTGKLQKLHRIIMKAPTGKEVDHINHNLLDNRKMNLRICTHKENMANRLRAKHNKSGYIGVSWHLGAGKWQARAKKDGKDKHLGYFNNALDASKARNEYVKTNYGGFAMINGTL